MRFPFLIIALVLTGPGVLHALAQNYAESQVPPPYDIHISTAPKPGDAIDGLQHLYVPNDVVRRDGDMHVFCTQMHPGTFKNVRNCIWDK